LQKTIWQRKRMKMTANELADLLIVVDALRDNVVLKEAATMLRQQAQEIEALKKELALQKLSDISQEIENEPVAWIDPKELDMDVSTSVTKHKQFNTDIPLYTSPQKYCPSENNEAYEKGFIDGMAKMTESAVHRAVEGMSVKTLTDEEITEIFDTTFEVRDYQDSFIKFARAILKKAEEK